MDKQLQEDSKKIHKTGRVAATSVIWGISGGMLAICIPLVIVTKTGAILPLATIVGAAVATFAVWNGEKNNSQVKHLEESSVLVQYLPDKSGHSFTILQYSF